MALELASFPDPQNVSAPITNAYAWVAQTNFNWTNGTGRIEVFVHRNAASAAATPPVPPAATLSIALGQTLVPAAGETAAVVFATLAQLQAMAETALAANPALGVFGAMRQAVYQALAVHPALAGATEVA